MKKILCLVAVSLLILSSMAAKSKKQLWPDGTVMDTWFADTTKVDINAIGKRYVITDYGVSHDSTAIQTTALQRVIDLCAHNGGGVVVVPRGTYLSGALFFRKGTNLLIEEGGKLKGSDRIENFPVCETRIEGQTCRYFPALINAEGLDGFIIAGKGTIDGNGYHYWKEFWIRREWNRACTNKDAQRPRLVYMAHCRNVTVQDVHLQNSPFWTNHLYKCERVRYLGCYIYAPTTGTKAPSSDAIDIDACSDVLINDCYMNVSDDAVVLKGGKGTWADQDARNGACERILIQNCNYGTVHGCLTLGSESLHDRNIILRNINATNARNVLWLKMRPDTPQLYEYVAVKHVTGKTRNFILVHPWTQFYHLEKRDSMPRSRCHHIYIEDVQMQCDNFYNVATSDKYELSDFFLTNVHVEDVAAQLNSKTVERTVLKNVVINGKTIK